MSKPGQYRIPLAASLALHALLVVFLLVDLSSDMPSLTLEARNTPGEVLEKPPESSQEVVRAVSVDQRAVDETLNRLKAEREQAKAVEKQRQQALAQQAQQALNQRLQEQKRLAQLKQESEKLAIARKKQMEDDARRLKELAQQKEKEAKQVEALKKQQQELQKQQEVARKKQEEAARLAKIEREKALEKQKLEAERLAKARAEQEALAAKKTAEEAQQAAARAARQAQIAGEVNKYKALIVNAISRQWILPDKAANGLSSQFRIRLAPDGAVLEVSLTRSSGDPVLDRSAQSAIYKASPLPVPTDKEMFELFRDISLTVRPENARG